MSFPERRTPYIFWASLSGLSTTASACDENASSPDVFGGRSRTSDDSKKQQSHPQHRHSQLPRKAMGGRQGTAELFGTCVDRTWHADGTRRERER
ncbi:hypothetical protein C8R45DRAFT_1041310 [Mycena sanguinolenta]|nr:hypothetical protein C8R45DRAFT_1041310 [Mycena sanguinolenta]